MKDKLLSIKKFPIILGLTSLLIALCSATFSVYGVGTLFAGASIAAMIMASVLEIGKIVATTYLYRYWTKTKLLLRVYLCSSVLLLMVITSLGIFGYLSSAYQKSSIEFKVSQEKIELLVAQKPNQDGIIKSAKNRIEELNKLRSMQESRLNEVLTNSSINRNPILLRQIQEQTSDIIQQTEDNIKEENSRINRATDELAKIDNKINDMRLGSSEKKDIQTFKFVADALGMTLDSVARWFILMVIVVFDPLAICLILAYNVAVYRKEDESVYDVPKNIEEQKIVEFIEQPVVKLEENKVSNDPIPTEQCVPVPPPAPPMAPEPVPAPPTPSGMHYDQFAKGYFK